MRRVLTFAAVLSFAAVVPGLRVPAYLQESQQPARPPAIRSGTNVVRVDVTVLNRHGEPITDLKPEDFQVEEDGVTQPLQAFQFVRATGFPDAGDEQSLPIRSVEHAASEAAREDVRVFLIFWDEYHINQFASSITGRQALSDFVLNAFGPRDLVALMDPLLPTDAIRFTRDRRALADAVAKLQGRRGVYVPARSAFEEALLRRPRDIDRVRFEVTMTALKAAAVFLGTLREGRKSIIFVSEGIGWRLGSGSPLQVDVIRAANEHNTAIYPVDPRGLGPRASEMLIELANSTGGQALVNTNAPGRLLRNVVKHASAYYLIGYAAQNSPADGKFHRIKVRVKRPDVDVRARTGYWAPTAGELTRAREAATREEKPLSSDARAAILAASGRRSIDLWVGTARGESGATNVTLAWAPHDNGRDPIYRASGVDVTATGPDGKDYFKGKVANGLVAFSAPPGLLTLQLSVQDADGQTLERDKRRIAVPDFSVPALSVSSPLLLRARTPLEMKALIADPDAPPFIGREFRRTDRILLRFEVYGARASNATVIARLMTRAGASLVNLPVAPVAGREGRYQVDLPLSNAARGDFMIAIEVNADGEQVQTVVPLKVIG
jgi:VWFA-related protein